MLRVLKIVSTLILCLAIGAIAVVAMYIMVPLTIGAIVFGIYKLCTLDISKYVDDNDKGEP